MTRLQARHQLEQKEKKDAEKKEINDSLNYKKMLDDQRRFILFVLFCSIFFVLFLRG